MKNNNHSPDSPDVALIMREGGDLPANLDPVVAMDVVRRYVESERLRSRRVVVWTSTIFLFVVFVVLTLFISVGVYVVRNSRETTEVVSSVRVEAHQAVAKVEGVVDRVAGLENKSDEILGTVEESETSRVIENRMFKANLERFGKWVAANGDQRAQSIGTMESRLKRMESLLDTRQKQMAELERKYAAALAQVGVAAGAAPVIEPSWESAPEAAPATGEREARAAVPSEQAVPARPKVPGRLREIIDPESARDELLSDRLGGVEGDAALDEVHVVRFPGGDRYEGQLRGGLLDGWGIYYFQNGDRYEGNFSEDHKQGYGVLYFHNGDIYKGEFLNDQRHGKGTYVFTNGSRYVGEFQDGKRHGRGRYIYEDGHEYIGEFRDGQVDGPGFSVLPGDQAAETSFLTPPGHS